MHSIPKLIQSIQSKSCPVSQLYKYQGQDWKEKIKYVQAPCPFPKTLWKSEAMELVLVGWEPNQFMNYYSGYGIVSSLVLDGNIIEMGNPLPKKYVVSPFNVWRLHTEKRSSQLLLYQWVLK